MNYKPKEKTKTNNGWGCIKKIFSFCIKGVNKLFIIFATVFMVIIPLIQILVSSIEFWLFGLELKKDETGAQSKTN